MTNHTGNKPPPEKTILLVEDEALIALAEKQVLNNYGYDVITAYGGAKAIEISRDSHVDLILMDIDLGHGKMDGTEAAKIILSERDIPVVFLSSHTEPEVVAKTEGITSYGYIVKNSGETVLIAAIKMAFRLFEARMSEKERTAELLHSRDLMRYVIEHNRGAVAVHDRDLNYIYVSQEYLRQYHVNEKDVIGRHHYDVFPDLPRKWRDVHQKALAGKVSSAEDDPYERADGTVEWTRWECRPWYEADGSIGGIIVYTEVTTTRKRLEKSLKEQVRYFETIIATTNDGFWEVDTRGRFVYVNDAYCTLSGYSREEFLKLSVPDIDADEQPEDTAERIQRVSREGVEVFQARHRRKNGELFDVEVYISYLDVGEGSFVCFCRDITERKKKESDLYRALKEKDFLMRELNHRMKNNLAMVNSMLRLKSSIGGDRVDLSDIISQVETIRASHDKLSLAENVFEIDLKGYIDEILSTVFSFSDKPVRINSDVPSVTLPEIIAVPLGLMVNEIATNAVKHGFKSKTGNVFSIEYKKNGKKNLQTLILKNNGEPIPGHVDLGNDATLGMKLISALAEQINSTVEMVRQPHPVFTIHVPGLPGKMEKIHER